MGALVPWGAQVPPDDDGWASPGADGGDVLVRAGVVAVAALVVCMVGESAGWAVVLFVVAVLAVLAVIAGAVAVACVLHRETQERGRGWRKRERIYRQAERDRQLAERRRAAIAREIEEHGPLAVELLRQQAWRNEATLR